MTKLVTLIEGKVWTVLATEDVAQVIESVSGKKKISEIKRLMSILEFFASIPPGQVRFDERQLKLEGSFPTGEKNGNVVPVLAVKAYQSRLYGCMDGKRRRLVITEHDLAKKKDKADRKKLTSAAIKFGVILNDER